MFCIIIGWGFFLSRIWCGLWFTSLHASVPTSPVIPILRRTSPFAVLWYCNILQYGGVHETLCESVKCFKVWFSLQKPGPTLGNKQKTWNPLFEMLDFTLAKLFSPVRSVQSMMSSIGTCQGGPSELSLLRLLHTSSWQESTLALPLEVIPWRFWRYRKNMSKQDNSIEFHFE